MCLACRLCWDRLSKPQHPEEGNCDPDELHRLQDDIGPHVSSCRDLYLSEQALTIKTLNYYLRAWRDQKCVTLTQSSWKKQHGPLDSLCWQWWSVDGWQRLPSLTEEEGLAREPTTGVNMSKEAQADNDREVWEEIDGV